MSEVYADLGGQTQDRWWCISVPCPECGAEAEVRCCNPICGTPKHVPCWRREKAAGGHQ